MYLAEARDASVVADDWRADPTAGRASGAVFNWHAMARFRPDRHMICARMEIANGAALALMQIDDDFPPFRSRPTESRAVYVSILEVHPGMRSIVWQRRFTGLGPAMLTFAIKRASQLGFAGRIGLHTIREAREFYGKIGFQEVADPGPNEYWETYLELGPVPSDRFLDEVRS